MHTQDCNFFCLGEIMLPYATLLSTPSVELESAPLLQTKSAIYSHTLSEELLCQLIHSLINY